ncbi:MAG: lysostaphin resistance A-like protein [Limisphaerales bacterium]
MTRLLAFGGFLLGVFGGAALVSPWLWWSGRWALAAWPQADLGWLVDHPFPRYVHRCLLALALAGLWPLTRALGCRTWEAAGWARLPGRWRRMAIGFTVGFLGFSILIAVEMATGARVWKSGLDEGHLAGGILRAAMAGIVVAIAEETLFRGVLFEGLRSPTGAPGAVLATAGSYSLAHFFSRPEPPNEVTWVSGFEVLAGMLSGFGAWDRLLPAFLTLFLLGVLFALMRLRERGVHGAVGLHAALVFWMKMRGLFTATSPIAPSGGDLISGAPALVLTGALVIAYLILSHVRGARSDNDLRPIC